MSELPTGWSYFSLRDLGGLSGGKTPSKANLLFWSSPDVPWVSPKDMKRNLLEDAEDRISQLAVDDAGMTLYPAGSVLMVTRSGILQHTFPVALAGTELTVNQDIKVFRPVEGISPQFAFYLLKSMGGKILSSCSKDGTTVQSIDSEKLEAFPFPLPPATEQTRIAAKLDELLAQVDTLKARIDGIPALLKRFRQSVLTAAVSGQLTEEWRGMNPKQRAEQAINALKAARPAKEQAHTPVFFEELPRIPESWEWASLGFLVSPDDVLCYGVVQPGPDDPDGVYLIRAGDINSGCVDTSQLRKISVNTHNEYRRSQVKGGEILITVVGAGIGEAAIIPPECAGFNIARAVAKLPIREISAKYVYLWLSTNLALSWMKGSSREVARPTLNLEQLRALPVPIPACGEQTEIVRRVEQLFAFADQLEARVKAAQIRIDRLTQSILAKAFRGELVPQDPNDEPASVLLERIKAQRAAAPKAKRGRRAATLG
ncbi:restriction endonuclease subunit S [Stutzerimonas frequens]|uniref:restriction endonuclease subunit S n=1 Tax=Stutzerimonas frequens TaxID=2968969 RepID=UPI001FFD1637|nr:restriction endonuclease subunit S [Stutzerimonas frequens]